MRHRPLLAAAALATLAAFTGCAKEASRPFADVDQNRTQSTETVAVAPEPAPQPTPQPTPQPQPRPAPTDPTVPPLERATVPTRTTVAELPPPTRPATDPQGRAVSSYEARSTQRSTEVAPTVSRQLRPIQLQVTPDGQLLRPWPESASYRPSGDTLAGPSYWPTTTAAARRDGLTNVYMEPFEFLVNGVLLPFRAIIDPPWTPVIYSPVNRVGGEP